MGAPMTTNLTYSLIILSRTYCVIILKKTELVWYGFIFLTIFSSYRPVTRTCWIISFSFTQNYSKSKNIKIKFEINLSTNEVHFLDVTISLKYGKLRTTLFTKPTDSQFYLYISSCHSSHVLKNIPKWQFIRLRHICSGNSDYFLNSELMCKNFMEHGFHEKELQMKIKKVAKKDRNDCYEIEPEKTKNHKRC